MADRNIVKIIRMTPDELQMIQQKMQQFGTTNFSAFVRKMAIDGYVVKLELPELKEMVSLLRYSSNNLNQLTKRVHETGRFYDADLEELQQSQERLWGAAQSILTALAKLQGCCHILALHPHQPYNEIAKEVLPMKWILKILTAPVILLIDLFTLVCVGIISCSAIPLRIVSGIIALLGTAVLVTYSPKNGMILLTIAFLFSPIGLPMLAVWILSILQGISQFIKAI